MALHVAQTLLSVGNLGYAEMTEFHVSNRGLRLSLSTSPSLPGCPPSNTDDGRFPVHQAQTTLGKALKDGSHLLETSWEGSLRQSLKQSWEWE